MDSVAWWWKRDRNHTYIHTCIRSYIVWKKNGSSGLMTKKREQLYIHTYIHTCIHIWITQINENEWIQWLDDEKERAIAQGCDPALGLVVNVEKTGYIKTRSTGVPNWCVHVCVCMFACVCVIVSQLYILRLEVRVYRTGACMYVCVCLHVCVWL